MLLANSTKLQPVKKSWGQGACICPLHVFLFLNFRHLDRIILKQGKSFELFFCDAPEDRSVVEWFMSFLEGEHGPFPLPLVFNFSPFTKKVLEELKKIPLGKTLSYRQVAENIGLPKAARAVGNACNANPFPLVIPCHRVVQTGGKLGGFAYGTELKEDLLHFERETIAAMQAL